MTTPDTPEPSERARANARRASPAFPVREPPSAEAVCTTCGAAQPIWCRWKGSIHRFNEPSPWGGLDAAPSQFEEAVPGATREALEESRGEVLAWMLPGSDRDGLMNDVERYVELRIAAAAAPVEPGGG